MFGFSNLPFSTSFTKFLNGFEEDLILYINRSDDISLCYTNTINITLYIEKDKIIEL